MGRTSALNCARCGKPLALVSPLGGKGPRRPTCLRCEEVDPIASTVVAGWFAGELQAPK
jgi:hypothetical protein